MVGGRRQGLGFCHLLHVPGELFDLSGSSSPQQEDGFNSNIGFIGLFRGLNEFAPVRHLEKYLAPSNSKLSLLLALGWFVYFLAQLGRDPLNLGLRLDCM